MDTPRNFRTVEHTTRAILYEINANGFKSRHKRYINKNDKTIEHAGIEIQIKHGWQRFELFGKEIKAKIIREWE